MSPSDSPPPGGSLLLLGELVYFRDDPGPLDDPDQLIHHPDGAVWIADGVVRASGARLDVEQALQDALAPGLLVPPRRLDLRGKLLLPGLIDCHLHYPQIGVMASWGRQLLDWLERYTFPAEAAFQDPAVATAAAEFVLDRLLAHGTTTASVFATVHAHSVDAFMAAALRRGMRMLCGKVMMDRHCPAELRDSVDSNLHEIPPLIERWHGRGRLRYTVTPRFAPTSTPAQLALASALYHSRPDLHLQSHLAENAAEIAWVAELFPDSPDYYGVYEAAGLTGPRAIYGHCLHLTPREQAAMHRQGSAIAFCPTSNLFLGSGVLDISAVLDRGQAVGLATDIGGGPGLSLIRTLAAAYQHSQLCANPLAPLRAWYLATLGGARALALDSCVGSLAPGYEGDCVVLDLAAIPELALRSARCTSLSERLFALAMLGDERCIHATCVAGHLHENTHQFAAPA